MIFIGDHFKEDGDWIWTSFCADEKYLMEALADGRGAVVAHGFVKSQIRKLAEDHVPTYVTDGYKPYRTALTSVYGRYVIDSGHRGRHSQDRLVLDPRLNYGIVEKTRQGKKLEKVRRYVAYGHVSEEDLNTSGIERSNLTLRMFQSRTRRRTVTFARSRRFVQAGLNLFRANYNLCKPHASLTLSKKQNGGVHKDVTPAMAMGLTDHVWSIGELHGFLYRQNIN